MDHLQPADKIIEILWVRVVVEEQLWYLVLRELNTSLVVVDDDLLHFVVLHGGFQAGDVVSEVDRLFH